MVVAPKTLLRTSAFCASCMLTPLRTAPTELPCTSLFSMSASPASATSPTCSKRIPARPLLTTRLSCTQKPFRWLEESWQKTSHHRPLPWLSWMYEFFTSTSFIAFKPQPVKPRKLGSGVVPSNSIRSNVPWALVMPAPVHGPCSWNLIPIIGSSALTMASRSWPQVTVTNLSAPIQKTADEITIIVRPISSKRCFNPPPFLGRLRRDASPTLYEPTLLQCRCLRDER